MIALIVRLKFHGVFRTATRIDQLNVEIAGDNLNVRSVVIRLVAQNEFGNLKQLLLNETTLDPRPKALILYQAEKLVHLFRKAVAMTASPLTEKKYWSTRLSLCRDHGSIGD